MRRCIARAALLPILLSHGMASSLSIQTESAKVTIQRERGGSISWISGVDGNNLINIHDLGRLVQQSYYAGKKRDRQKEGQSPRWSPWSWNPVQGGSFQGESSQVDIFEKKDGQLFSRTTPKLWDMPDENAQAIMEQWTSFEPGMPEVVSVRNRVTCTRAADDDWGAAVDRHQELPAIYLVRSMRNAKIYIGDQEWEDYAMPHLGSAGWGRILPPRHAMAFFDDRGRGFAIYSPRADTPWNCGVVGDSSTEDPDASETVHVAPLATLAFGPDAVFDFRYWIILGDQETIARRLDELLARSPD